MNAGNPISASASLRVFASHVHAFTIDDVLHAAAFRGELHHRWQELCHALACEEVALQNGHALDEELLQSLCDEFRYSRELVTAEETEAWLLRSTVLACRAR